MRPASRTGWGKSPLLPYFSWPVTLLPMKSMAYCTYREDEFVVAQCLNVDVSSFGATREEAIANLKEAVELYFEGESNGAYTSVTDVAVGEEMVNA
jgi:predicted RNase H-like HicB family nuclease